MREPETERKIDDMEIVLSGLPLREIAEIVVYSHNAVDALRKNMEDYIKAYVDLYKKTNGGKMEGVKDE